MWDEQREARMQESFYQRIPGGKESATSRTRLKVLSREIKVLSIEILKVETVFGVAAVCI